MLVEVAGKSTLWVRSEKPNALLSKPVEKRKPAHEPNGLDCRACCVERESIGD